MGSNVFNGRDELSTLRRYPGGVHLGFKRLHQSSLPSGPAQKHARNSHIFSPSLILGAAVGESDSGIVGGKENGRRYRGQEFRNGESRWGLHRGWGSSVNSEGSSACGSLSLTIMSVICVGVSPVERTGT